MGLDRRGNFDWVEKKKSAILPFHFHSLQKREHFRNFNKTEQERGLDSKSLTAC